jgi:predicted amidohydrolase
MKELQIALLQSPLFWEQPHKNRTRFAEKIATLSPGIDLVVLPEMFSTGFTMQPGNISKEEGQKTLEWMLGIAQTYKLAITGSVVFYEKGNYYNRLLFVAPNGTVASYDKRHTFTLAGETKVYKAGGAKLMVDYKGFKICPLICYDLRFPVWSRNVENYDVLVYVANWPAPRIAAWDTLLKARAIENMAYCIGVNRVGNDEVGHTYPGHSGVYGPLGEQIVFSQEEEILYATLIKEEIDEVREKLRFLEDRDVFNFEL